MSDELHIVIDGEAEIKAKSRRKRSGLNTNRIITPEMLENERMVAIEIAKARIAVAFDNCDDLVAFIREVWEAKENEKLAKVEQAIESLGDDDLQKLLAKFGMQRKATSKKAE